MLTGAGFAAARGASDSDRTCTDGVAPAVAFTAEIRRGRVTLAASCCCTENAGTLRSVLDFLCTPDTERMTPVFCLMGSFIGLRVLLGSAGIRATGVLDLEDVDGFEEAAGFNGSGKAFGARPFSMCTFVETGRWMGDGGPGDSGLAKGDVAFPLIDSYR